MNGMSVLTLASVLPGQSILCSSGVEELVLLGGERYMDWFITITMRYQRNLAAKRR